MEVCVVQFFMQCGEWLITDQVGYKVKVKLGDSVALLFYKYIYKDSLRLKLHYKEIL